MKYFSFLTKILVCAASLAIFTACATKVNISHDLSPAELIQRAQEASDKYRYKVALQYYQALLDRSGGDIDMVIAAEYEIAFIYYKQNKFQASREKFNDILKYYESPDAELLPPQYKRLSEIVLVRIDEKEKAWRPFKRREK